MRTTLNIDDDLYRALKVEAAETGQTLTELVEKALRRELEKRRVDSESYSYDPPTVSGGGAREGVDVADRDELYDTMEDQ